MPETPFLADDGLPDFDPKASLRDLSLQRMKEQVQANPFATGVAQGRPGKPPTHFLDNPAPRPQDPMTPVYEALSPTQQGYGIGQAVGGAAAHATHGRLMDAALEVAPLVAAMAIPGAPKGGGRGVKVRPEIPRELDSMGFYSQALEAAKAWPQPRGTPEQVLAALKQAGVKDAEIKATNLPALLDGKPSVTREELVQHLRENRVQMLEGRYGGSDTEPDLRVMGRPERDGEGNTVYEYEDRNSGHQFTVMHDHDAGNVYIQGPGGRFIDVDRPMNKQSVTDAEHAIGQWLRQSGRPRDVKGEARWDSTYGGQDLSLGGPGNPSYRESVINLGPDGRARQIEAQMKENQRHIHDLAQNADLAEREKAWGISRLVADPDALKDLSPAEKGRAAVARDQKLRDDPELARLRSLRDQNEALRDELKQINAGRYKEGHFPDEPNYLWHTRQSLQKGPQGQTVLHGDELQSTRGQAIRDSGGARDEAKIAELGQRARQAEVTKEELLNTAAKWAEGHGMNTYNLGGRRATLVQLQKHGDESIAPGIRQQATEHIAAIDRAVNDWNLASAELRNAQSAVPGHPLVNTTDQWTTTALRRLIQQAVEAKAEGISLTPGDLQNERYSLSKYVSALRYSPDTQGLHYRPAKLDGRIPSGNDPWYSVAQVSKEELPSHVGKEMAEQLLAQPLRPFEGGGNYMAHHLEQLGYTEIGGQGMRSFYDKIAPNRLDKELKRMDPQYPGRGQTELWTSKDQLPKDSMPAPYPDAFHYFPLTQKIREEVAKGLPLFSVAALMAAVARKPNEHPEVSEDNPFAPMP